MPSLSPTTERTPASSQPSTSVRARLVAVLAASTLLAAACTGSADDAAPPATTSLLDQLDTEEVIPAEDPTRPTLPVPADFVQPDTRGVVLTPVTADPKPQPEPPPLPVQGGQATLTGIVTGPDGPVDGAVVRLERIVGGRIGVLDVRTGSDGTYRARDLLGGRYRLRAFLQPDLAGTESQLAFLGAEETVDVRLGVSRHDALVLQAAADAPGWLVGDTMGVRVLLLRESVDDDGIVVGDPVPATAVSVASPSGVRTLTEPPITTGADGAVVVRVECLEAGPPRTADVVAEGVEADAVLPRCAEPPTPTTALAVVALPVGGSFTTPAGGPVPAGTYRTDDGEACRISYEMLQGDSWLRQVVSVTGLTLRGPARNLRSASAEPCTFERTS